jgi:fermentation-respiration switch protein FrsA (DUF1100 family)
MPRRVLSGSLITYQHGTEIGRERYTDDGRELHSEVRLRDQTFALDMTAPEPDGLPGKARVEAEGRVVEREIPLGTIALESGAWQAYAIAARAYHGASDPLPVHVLVPGEGEIVEGSIRVTPAEDGGDHVELQVGPTLVTAEVAPSGAVTHVAVPSEGIEVIPEGEAAPPASRPRASLNPKPPATVEEPFELTREEVVLHGTYWIPANPERAAMPLPVVVVVPGAGPVDRDGNDVYGLRTDAYRQLASGVTSQNVVTLRYDKRGVGQSVLRSPDAPITFEALVTDLSAIVSAVRADERFGRVILAAHSEGGLVAMMLARAVPIDALVVIGCPGRPMEAVLRQQLARRYDREALAAAERILATLRAGGRVASVPSELEPVLGPAAQPYIASLLEIDPVALIRNTRGPLVVAQGDLDPQVSMEDASRLVDARPGAKLIRLPRMNHVLKDQSKAVPEASYDDPRLPVARGIIDTVVAMTR